MGTFIAEVIGTAILIVFGGGVVANVVLQRTKGNGSGWIVIATGWGLGVAMAVYCVGSVSGAHINPAVTVSLAIIGKFAWAKVPAYVAAQVLGAFLGACLVWLAYVDHFEATEDAGLKLAVFSTAPEIRRIPSNFVTEFIGTAMLLFGVLAIGANAGVISKTGPFDMAALFSHGINPLLVGFLVWALGLSLGGPTGYAINPARDLGPRIAHALLPIGGKGPSDWSYAWVPVVAPLAGGAAGAWLFRICFLG